MESQVVLVTYPDNWKFVVDRTLISEHFPILKSLLSGETPTQVCLLSPRLSFGETNFGRLPGNPERTEFKINQGDGRVLQKVLGYVRHPNETATPRRLTNWDAIRIDDALLYKVNLVRNTAFHDILVCN